MANLTVTIDSDVLRAARIRALERGVSVNALVRDYLVGFATTAPVRDSISAVVEAARASSSNSGPQGRTWRREDLHER